MKKRLMIDVLEQDEDIAKLSEKSSIDYKFVSIFEYVKDVYDITIVDMSSALGTTRQTIYNSFTKKSDKLSNHIKEKLAYVYEVRTFSEVIELEKKRELAYWQDRPLLSELINDHGGLSFDEIQHDYVKHTYETVYELVYHPSTRWHNVEIKPKYDFEKMWKRAVHEAKAKALGMKTFEMETIQSEKLESILRGLINRTSAEYVEALLRSLRNKVDHEDIKLINYIDDY